MSLPAEPNHALRLGGGALVTAPGRLHLGFLDPNATLGRRFGSLGLAIDHPNTTIELHAAAQDQLIARTPQALQDMLRVREWLALLRQASGLDLPLAVTLHEVLPAHAGFGSGTQLALALGRAFAIVHGLRWSSTDIARLLGRGARSGIGVAGFDEGGLMADGGSAGTGGTPPLLARIAFPEDWRILLVLDARRKGLHGEAEKQAIRNLPPFPQHLAAELCHRVVMQILPAAAEQDFAPLAEGINHLQQTIGAYFSPAQGGVYASPAVARVLQWMAQHSAAAVGQSSWGPTGFAILPSQAAAEQALSSARAAGAVDAELQLRIVRGRNAGARVMHAPEHRNAA